MARRCGAPTVTEDPTFAHGVLFFMNRLDLTDVRAVERWLDGATVGRGEQKQAHYDKLLTEAVAKTKAARRVKT